MPGPVDKAKLKFKLKDCSPLNCTSRLKAYLRSGKFAKSLRIKKKINKSLFIVEFQEDIYR